MERNHKVDIPSNRFSLGFFSVVVLLRLFTVMSVAGLNVSPNENMHKVMPNFRSISFVALVSALGLKTLLSQNIDTSAKHVFSSADSK